MEKYMGGKYMGGTYGEVHGGFKIRKKKVEVMEL